LLLDDFRQFSQAAFDVGKLGGFNVHLDQEKNNGRQDEHNDNGVVINGHKQDDTTNSTNVQEATRAFFVGNRCSMTCEIKKPHAGAVVKRGAGYLKSVLMIITKARINP
jgi:hypothetical protein